MDFVQTRSLILLANDNHSDINFKEIFANVYFGSIVNNRPKTWVCYFRLFDVYICCLLSDWFITKTRLFKYIENFTTRKGEKIR